MPAGKEWEDEHGRLVLDESTFVASMLSGRMSKTLKEKNHVVRRGRTRSMSFSLSKSASKSPTDPLKPDTESHKPKVSSEGSLLCNRDRLIRWIHGKKIFANSLSGATALLLLAVS